MIELVNVSKKAELARIEVDFWSDPAVAEFVRTNPDIENWNFCAHNKRCYGSWAIYDSERANLIHEDIGGIAQYADNDGYAWWQEVSRMVGEYEFKLSFSVYQKFSDDERCLLREMGVLQEIVEDRTYTALVCRH